MVRHFIDSNIFFYARITDKKYGRKCADILRALAKGRIQGVLSSLILLEVANALRKYGWGEVVEEVVTSIAALPLDIEQIDSLDVKRAIELFTKYRISPYDCSHIAIMIREGLQDIISADEDFDKAKEVKRIDPLSFQITRA